jgi:hypothetical protein
LLQEQRRTSAQRKENKRTTAAAPATSKGMPQCSIMLLTDEETLKAATMIKATTMLQIKEEIQPVVASDKVKDRIWCRR